MKLTIRQWRKIKEISMESMAEKLGVSRATYIKYEKEPGKIKFSVASEIAEILGVDFEDIIFLPSGATNC